MNFIQILATITGLSLTSGINLYATVLVAGLGIRLNWIHGLPQELNVLSHPAVLTVAALMYLLEFFADKIPFVSTAWDAIHTFVRPLGGALLALQSSAELHPVIQAVAFLAGGSIALLSHGSKAAFRVSAHVSPEPISHSLVSLLEDAFVIGLLALIYAHPKIALAVIVAALLCIVMLLHSLFYVLKRLLSRAISWMPLRRSSIP